MRSPVDAAVREFFTRSGIEPCRLIAAVSGGTDSTALLLALSGLREDRFALEAAHVNHHLRGSESDEDEEFVRELCRELGVTLHVSDGTLDPALVRERGIEAAARTIRYEQLAKIRTENDARFVATAHQKNDQAETVLMRLLSGSGIAGLRGIHPIRDDGFVRPLLDVTRDAIDDYLREHDITPRHDRSNDDPRFLRNRVRVLVRELGATENLASIADQARQQWPIFERAIDDAERECVEVRDDESRFHAQPDSEWLRAALLQRHIRRLDPSARDFDAQRIARELPSIKRTSVTKTLELVRQGETLILRRPPKPTNAFELDLTPDNPTFIAQLGLTIRVIPSGARDLGGRGANIEPIAPPTQVPRSTLGMTARQPFQLPERASATFTIRNRRPGDRFQPLGFPSSKKLKDFLIDRKIPAEIRDRLPLLIWNGEIVWVAGVEISERFKVTDSAGGIYEVWMEDSGAPCDDDHDDRSRIQR
ncbi:MAG TPA: tRNA lysidine(34) synthetase TilS [Thermoanaerobaculia bacterium]|nr:tRNA lysidine(34) synthetase TilS [Thermoanaerobaculia bacterium]